MTLREFGDQFLPFMERRPDGYAIRIEDDSKWFEVGAWSTLIQLVPSYWMDLIIVENRWFEDDKGKAIFVIELEDVTN